MELVIFQFWLLIIGFLTFFSIWKRNALTLMLAGLFLFGFGGVLNLDGLRIVSGFNSTTGNFNYITITPLNDGLFAMFAIGTIPVAMAVILFSLVVLYDEMIKQYRLWT